MVNLNPPSVRRVHGELDPVRELGVLLAVPNNEKKQGNDFFAISLN